MRIIVPLRRVLDPAGVVVHRRLRRLFINREEYIIQPADHSALEAALRLRDAHGGEVVVVSGQPEPDDDTVRRGLATGADRAIYLTGGAFEAADEAVVARALHSLIERLGGAQLVLAGLTTMETGQTQLGVRLAELLNWPQIVDVWSTDLVDGALRAVRRDGERLMRVEVDLPAVALVAADALEPRYPDGVRLIDVYRGEGDVAEALEQWEVTDHLTPEELAPAVECIGRDYPPERERGERVTGTPEEMARTVAEALQRRMPR
ncbi:MAG: electron transfer flavoprotein subunit beta/FixA family protein [Chloroflexota bacterium]